MKHKIFFSIVAVIFSLITILHALRIINGWSAIIGNATIPMWLSWLAVIISGFLAYQSFKLSK